MSSELLRRAADRLDELAGAARDVTGAADWHPFIRGLSHAGDYGVRSSGGVVCADAAEEEAAYIAALSPNVATALAEWLRFASLYKTDRHANVELALEVARQILGPDAA